MSPALFIFALLALAAPARGDLLDQWPSPASIRNGRGEPQQQKDFVNDIRSKGCRALLILTEESGEIVGRGPFLQQRVPSAGQHDHVQHAYGYNRWTDYVSPDGWFLTFHEPNISWTIYDASNRALFNKPLIGAPFPPSVRWAALVPDLPAPASYCGDLFESGVTRSSRFLDLGPHDSIVRTSIEMHGLDHLLEEDREGAASTTTPRPTMDLPDPRHASPKGAGCVSIWLMGRRADRYPIGEGIYELVGDQVHAWQPFRLRGSTSNRDMIVFDAPTLSWVILRNGKPHWTWSATARTGPPPPFPPYAEFKAVEDGKMPVLVHCQDTFDAQFPI